MALLFGVLVTWRGWATWRAVQAANLAFNVVFARIGRGSYALYLLHYPLLLALRQVLVTGHASIIVWIGTGVLFLLFVVLFCPWIEKISVMLFRPELAIQRHPV